MILFSNFGIDRVTIVRTFSDLDLESVLSCSQTYNMF